ATVQMRPELECRIAKLLRATREFLNEWHSQVEPATRVVSSIRELQDLTQRLEIVRAAGQRERLLSEPPAPLDVRVVAQFHRLYREQARAARLSRSVVEFDRPLDGSKALLVHLTAEAGRVASAVVRQRGLR